jgi:hypothetical protein
MVKYIDLTDPLTQEVTTYAIVEIADGYESMTKAEYDRRQAEQSTPNLSPTE